MRLIDQHDTSNLVIAFQAWAIPGLNQDHDVDFESNTEINFGVVRPSSSIFRITCDTSSVVGWSALISLGSSSAAALPASTFLVYLSRASAVPLLVVSAVAIVFSPLTYSASTPEAPVELLVIGECLIPLRKPLIRTRSKAEFFIKRGGWELLYCSKDLVGFRGSNNIGLDIWIAFKLGREIEHRLLYISGSIEKRHRQRLLTLILFSLGGVWRETSPCCSL